MFQAFTMTMRSCFWLVRSLSFRSLAFGIQELEGALEGFGVGAFGGWSFVGFQFGFRIRGGPFGIFGGGILNPKL